MDSLTYEYQFRCWYLMRPFDKNFPEYDCDTRLALIQSLSCDFDGQEANMRQFFWRCHGAKSLGYETESPQELPELQEKSPTPEEE